VFALWYSAGAVHLSLDGLELLDCGNGCFSGGPLTGHDSQVGVDPCDGPVFTVCVSCAPSCIGTVAVGCCDDREISERLALTVTESSCADGTFGLASVYEVDYCGTSGSGASQIWYWIGVATGCTASCPNIVCQITCPAPGFIRATVYLYVAGACVSASSGCTFTSAHTGNLACGAAFPWTTPTGMVNVNDFPDPPCCVSPAVVKFSIDEVFA
jgi:hypothetical protein